MRINTYLDSANSPKLHLCLTIKSTTKPDYQFLSLFYHLLIFSYHQLYSSKQYLYATQTISFIHDAGSTGTGFFQCVK
jgi:hypothetical protein